MTTLSVPVPAQLEKFIDDMVATGEAANKADVVRRALYRMREEEAIQAVLHAEQEVAEGKLLKGDLRKLLKNVDMA